MSELHRRPGDWSIWSRAIDGETVDWDAIFRDYAAAADAPVCHFFRELAIKYPNAKIILSTRDPERWYKSTQSTILLPEIGKHFTSGPPELSMLMRKMGWHADDASTHDRTAMIKRFNDHNAEVIRAFTPERLLIFEPSAGWEPLCRFLGKTVPSVPFPHINSTEEFEKMLANVPEFDPEAVSRSIKEQVERKLAGE
jgi:hypothetical protein